ncbi:hypothetical protein KEM56_002611 [Ascosphaera pollenicola]|nr:hypothetical protein KEM56_002611 [Ascosphaera pollenicola]
MSATLTQIPEGEMPTVAIHPDRKVSKIDDLIYSGFTEHMGRCIYGGIYDPGNPNSDENGFRLDVLDALKELNIPVMRYPGGNFIATYHWEDAIGPLDQRKARPELAWLGTEPNTFGTDEFMKWCRKLGAEPYFALNMATGTLTEAMAWVEYCNGTRDTYYANLRRKNGHHEPYNVKYWALGNEVWGPWQVEQHTQEDYTKKAQQWAKALKLLDPNLVLILCGKEGATSWDYYTLKNASIPANSPLSTTSTTLIDMHSIHLYTASKDPVKNALQPLCAERAIEITSSLIDLARIENEIPNSEPRPKICFDEWNVWDPIRALGSKGGEESYTLHDALGVAVWLNVFIRKSRDIGMACLAQSVNVISPLMTTKEGIIKQTTWWPLLLFSKYMRGHAVATHVSSPYYDGDFNVDNIAPGPRGWLPDVKDVPYLDVSAAINDDGYVAAVIVNAHDKKDFETKVEGPNGKEVQVFTVWHPDVHACNMHGNPQEVTVKESTWDGKGTYTFLKHSVTMMRWKA